MFFAMAKIWRIDVRPRAKILLVYIANCGERGMATTPDALADAAVVCGMTPAKIERTVAALIKRGHVEEVPPDPAPLAEPRMAVRIAGVDWTK